MPSLTGVLETGVYVADMKRARDFYQSVFDLEPMVADDRFCAFPVAGRHVLLLFLEGGSAAPIQMPGGVLPPHDGTGTQHFAFSIDAAELPAWERRLAEKGIAIESRVRWERGGVSLYFRDPDQHLLELVTPGCWPIY